MVENLNYVTIEGSYLRDKKYGRYYIWDTACNLCPIGWHLPRNIEWQDLIDYQGEGAGKGMQAKSWCYPIGIWNPTYVCGTNESGFNALSAGGVWPDTVDIWGHIMPGANFGLLTI